MRPSHIRINSEPRDVASLPFASESPLQRFVKEHAKDLLGLQVVGVAERGGGMISKIDIFALDHSGKPWIIECKHDLVNARAISQLRRYCATVLARWPHIRKLISLKCGPTNLEKHPRPGLMTVGFRYDQRLAKPDDVICLAYQYHGVKFTDESLQEPRPGGVSLHHFEDIPMPTQRHPRVSKKDSTLTRLARLDRSLVASFWDLDRELTKLRGVHVTYGGKNFVRYRTAAGVFATAVIGAEAIEWRLGAGEVVALRGAPDVSEILTALRKAHQAG